MGTPRCGGFLSLFARFGLVTAFFCSATDGLVCEYPEMIQLRLPFGVPKAGRTGEFVQSIVSRWLGFGQIDRVFHPERSCIKESRSGQMEMLWIEARFISCVSIGLSNSGGSSISKGIAWLTDFITNFLPFTQDCEKLEFSPRAGRVRREHHNLTRHSGILLDGLGRQKKLREGSSRRVRNTQS